MRRVKISLPATVTNLGPGLRSLGLALSLRTTVEIIERADDTLNVETTGEGAGRYAVGLRHPVVSGLIRVFQQLERTVLGLTIRIDSQIPQSGGLGAETSFLIAGVIGANNLFGNPFSRQQVLEMAAAMSGRPDHAVTAILGGLTASMMNGGTPLYRSLPVAPLRGVLIVPELEGYADEVGGITPERVLLNDALHNLRHLPLTLEAMRTGDLKLLAQALDDRLLAPFRVAYIPGYEAVGEAARRMGASAVSLCGEGPALLAFADSNHAKLADAMRTTFAEFGIGARAWPVQVDTQGVVISVAGTG